MSERLMVVKKEDAEEDRNLFETLPTPISPFKDWPSRASRVGLLTPPDSAEKRDANSDRRYNFVSLPQVSAGVAARSPELSLMLVNKSISEALASCSDKPLSVAPVTKPKITVPSEGVEGKKKGKEDRSIAVVAPKRSRIQANGKEQIWFFFVTRLLDPAYKDVLQWTGNGLEFVVKNEEALCALWSAVNCRKKLISFESVKRGMRQTYHDVFLHVSPAKRLWAFNDNIASQIDVPDAVLRSFIKLHSETGPLSGCRHSSYCACMQALNVPPVAYWFAGDDVAATATLIGCASTDPPTLSMPICQISQPDNKQDVSLISVTKSLKKRSIPKKVKNSENSVSDVDSDVNVID